MNGDNVKTVILIILVITGLLLTVILWYGSPRYEETDLIVEDPFFFEEPRDGIYAIFPARIVLPLSGEEYLLCRRGTDKYGELWELILSCLQENYFTEEKNGFLPEHPLAIIYFDPPFPWEVIANAAEQADISVERMQFFINDNDGEMFLLLQGAHEDGTHEELVLKTAEDHFLPEIQNLIAAMIDEDNPRYHLLTDALFADGDQSVPGEVRIEGDIYLPAEDYLLQAHLTLVREQIRTDEMLKAVFVNEKLARKIEEADGTLIFTDGEKGLRISDYVEYTAPRLEKGMAAYSYARAIQKANEYLCYYGGWPKDLYLVHMLAGNNSRATPQQGETSYYVGWSFYADGLPIMGSPGRTEIRFNDQGLYYYKRSLYRPSDFSTKKVTAAAATEAVAKAFEYYYVEETDVSTPVKLRDIYPAYKAADALDGNEVRAYPVWVVRINDATVYLDLADLTLSGRSEHDEYF